MSATFDRVVMCKNHALYQYTEIVNTKAPTSGGSDHRQLRRQTRDSFIHTFAQLVRGVHIRRQIIDIQAWNEKSVKRRPERMLSLDQQWSPEADKREFRCRREPLATSAKALRCCKQCSFEAGDVSLSAVADA